MARKGYSPMKRLVLAATMTAGLAGMLGCEDGGSSNDNADLYFWQSNTANPTNISLSTLDSYQQGNIQAYRDPDTGWVFYSTPEDAQNANRGGGSSDDTTTTTDPVETETPGR